MPGKFTLSKRADRAVADIYRDTLREWGERQADKYIDGLEGCLQLLADSPGLGRKCDDIKAGYQRFEYERHIIFYRTRKSDIFIVHILHDRMDVQRRV